MEIKGTIIKIMDELTGESSRGKWVRSGFVVETEDTYPKKVAFTSLGEERASIVGGLRNGDVVNVTFAPESRSYTDRNGEERWETELRFIHVNVEKYKEHE